MESDRSGSAGGQFSADLPGARLAPFVQWVAQAGTNDLLDISFPPGAVARAMSPHVRRLVLVSPRKAVADALRAAGRPDLEIETCGLDALPFPDRSFSVITGLPLAAADLDLEATFRELARVLTDDGFVLLSLSRSMAGRATAEPDAAAAALKESFAHVETLPRRDWLVSAIGDGWETRDVALAPCPVESTGAPETILVASHGDIPVRPGPVVSLQPVDLNAWATEWSRALTEPRESGAPRRSENVAEMRTRLLRELFHAEQALGEMFDKYSVQANRAAHVEHLTTVWERTKAEASEAHAQLAVAHAEIARAHAEIRDLRQSTSWRMTAALRRFSGLFKRHP